MERETNIKSPFTGGKVKEVITTEQKTFRGEKFDVNTRYYVCEDTDEQFTTTEQDTLTFNDLYSQYRNRHGIPFADEIKDIRERFGLSLKQISIILGFGVNQYSSYEDGVMPSQSNGKAIASLRHKDGVLNALNACKHEFSQKEFDEIYTRISSYDKREARSMEMLRSRIFYSPRSIFNGFATQSYEKVNNLTIWIVDFCKGCPMTKLNKLLYYIDSYAFREIGQAISGLSYEAIQYGPVPYKWNKVYANLDGIEADLKVYSNGSEGIVYNTRQHANRSLFSDKEACCIDTVLQTFGKFNSKRIMNLSHGEDGWIKYSQEKSLIPFTEALTLKAL